MAHVSGRLFDVLGVTGFRGRMLTPADDGGPNADGRSGRCHQPSSLAAAFRRRPRHRRAPAHGAAHSVHDRRRDAAGILRSRRRPDDGRDVAVRGRAAHPRPGEPVGREELVVAADHGAAEAGQSLEQANAALRVLQAQITEGASRQLQPFTLVAAATGNSSLRRASKRRSSRWSSPWGSCCSSRAPTSPVSCSRGRWRAAASSACAWRSGAPLAHRTAAFHRESDRGRHRCGGRLGVRVVEQRAPRAGS